MARKATDLLDVFRFSSEDGGGKRPKRRSRGNSKGGGGRSKGAKKKSRAKRTFEGIFLNARQLLLASSALMLLLVLSFVLGLATGRGGEETPAIQRSHGALIAVRARLPVVDPATRRSVRPSAVEKRLSQDYEIPSRNIRIQRDGTELVIEIGPFHSEAQAKRFIERSGLDMAHIHMENPFRYAEFVPYRRD